MDSKELSLTWDDHHSTLVGVFEKLLESSTLVDCTIAAEGQYLKAHKIVLSACSPYFELLFKQENEKNPIIVLKDVKFRELKAMIDFVYRGEVSIPEDALQDFISTAESLEIKGIGGGQKRDVSQKKDLKSPIHKTDGHVSPVLRKRVRRRHRRNNEENISSFSSAVDITSESESCESPPPYEESADVPVSFSSVLSTPSNSSSSEVVYGLRVQEEFNSVTTDPSTSYVQPMHASMPITETHPPLPSTETVIKSEPEPEPEPEPVEEIYLPESEDFVEAKQEHCAEELSLLESEDKMDVAATSDMCEQNSTQFSNLPPIMETTDTKCNEQYQVAGDNTLPVQNKPYRQFGHGRRIHSQKEISHHPTTSNPYTPAVEACTRVTSSVATTLATSRAVTTDSSRAQHLTPLPLSQVQGVIQHGPQDVPQDVRNVFLSTQHHAVRNLWTEQQSVQVLPMPGTPEAQAWLELQNQQMRAQQAPIITKKTPRRILPRQKNPTGEAVLFTFGTAYTPVESMVSPAILVANPMTPSAAPASATISTGVPGLQWSVPIQDTAPPKHR